MKIDGWLIPLVTLVTIALASAFARYPIEHSSDLASWVQAAGSILAIAIAIWVSRQQFKDTMLFESRRAKAEADKDAAETRAFVQAVREELGTIWDTYSARMGNTLRVLPDNHGFTTIFPVTSDAFTIYNNASAAVGKVPDDELRRLIVIVYAKAKGIVSSFQMNNQLVIDYLQFEMHYRGEDRVERMANKVESLVSYAAMLKESDRELGVLVAELFARADAWLAAQQR